MGVQLCVLSVVVPVCSQPAQAVTRKETFAGVKAAGTCVNDGGMSEKGGRLYFSLVGPNETSCQVSYIS
jgi:hypothetical protein